MAAFSVRGPIERGDLPGLCGRICEVLAERGPGELRCEVAGVEPDAVTVDALARLQLAAQRHGCRIRLAGASAALEELVELMGLKNVFA
ncbi:MAG: STAS domain-containing protein [Thermoleophilia bacterium]|nr:STAS domain-containing protein [Thermoleophilia bacterium]